MRNSNSFSPTPTPPQDQYRGDRALSDKLSFVHGFLTQESSSGWGWGGAYRNPCLCSQSEVFLTLWFLDAWD